MSTSPALESAGSPPTARIKDLLRICAKFIKSISVELSATFYGAAAGGSALIWQQLLLEKCCVYQLGYSKDVCDHLDDESNRDAEIATQKLAARYDMYDSLFLNIIPVFVALLVGHWTDIHGRKPVILFCFITNTVQQLGMIVNVAYMSWSPIYMSILSSLPYSIGSWTTILIAVYSYVSDVTTPSERSVRMAILILFLYFGEPLGVLVGAKIYKSYGYYGAFSYFAAASAFGGIYSAVRLDANSHKRPIDRSLCTDAVEPVLRPTGSKFKDLANAVYNVRETFRTFFRPREGKRREVLFLMVIAACVALFPLYGESDLDVLFLKKRFGWTIAEISYYNTYRTCVQVIGTLALTPILKFTLKWEDTKVGVASDCLLMVSCLMTAFAVAPWMVYASGALYVLFPSAAGAVIRSLISKMVDGDELGKAYAVMGFSEAIVPLLSGLVYDATYRATVATFPGAAFIMSAACWLVTAIIFVVAHFAHAEHASHERRESKVIIISDDGDADSGRL